MTDDECFEFLFCTLILNYALQYKLYCCTYSTYNCGALKIFEIIEIDALKEDQNYSINSNTSGTSYLSVTTKILLFTYYFFTIQAACLSRHSSKFILFLEYDYVLYFFILIALQFNLFEFLGNYFLIF